MNISRKLSDKEMNEILQQFYEYFENGFVFERFLKEYLQAIGLEEVELTKPTRDDGVDLKAVRKGVGEFSNADTTRYYVQAKRYKPGSQPIAPKLINELRGSMPMDVEKGIFITTSSFSNKAQEKALDRNFKPVVLIDGEKLVSSCIDNEIGFYYKPVFSKRLMDEILNKEKNNKDIPASTETFVSGINQLVEKTITTNDIRARIISIPSSILGQIPADIQSINVVVNDTNTYTCSVNRTRNFLGGVTKIFKEYGLWNKEDGIINFKESKWILDPEKMIIKLYIG